MTTLSLDWSLPYASHRSAVMGRNVVSSSQPLAALAPGGLTPEQKRDWVLAHDERDTLMLGDGANDSLAFDAAFARGTPVISSAALRVKAPRQSAAVSGQV